MTSKERDLLEYLDSQVKYHKENNSKVLKRAIRIRDTYTKVLKVSEYYNN